MKTNDFRFILVGFAQPAAVVWIFAFSFAKEEAVKLKMHFHLIFECKFSLLCARFLHIFLLNFDRIFKDFRQILDRRGTSEASGATSWHLGGSKSEFLMIFGGSRVSFWSPWATLGTSVLILWPHFMTLFCMQVFKCVFGSVFNWIWRPWTLKSECFA